MRAVFLSLIGPAKYKILRNLVSPKKPGEKTYDELVETLSKHFKPTPSEIVERYKFHSCFRKPGKSVATFVSELRSLSQYCNFGDLLDVMIRDCLVCGINDDLIQKRLLAEPRLTYEKAVELSQSMEIAAQNVKDLKVKQEGSGNTQPQQQEVHRLICPWPHTRKTSATCYPCGIRAYCKQVQIQ